MGVECTQECNSLLCILWAFPYKGLSKLKLTPQYGDHEASKQASNQCVNSCETHLRYTNGLVPISGVRLFWFVFEM